MRPAEEPEEQETSSAPPRLSRWEALREGMPGERAIQEAMRRGEFDNLPGRGKPLRIDPSECAADAIVAGMLKEANVVPEWIEQARAIEEGQAAIAQAMDIARQQFAALEAAAAARLGR